MVTARHSVASTRNWPPDPPAVGDLVLFGGYPEAYTARLAGKVDFGFAWLAGRLDAMSEENATLILRLETSLAVEQRILPGTDLSGMSGGPVFRVREAPVAYLEMVAVIYEYSSGMEMAKAHPLTLVEPDGRLVATGPDGEAAETSAWS